MTGTSKPINEETLKKGITLYYLGIRRFNNPNFYKFIFRKVYVQQVRKLNTSSQEYEILYSRINTSTSNTKVLYYNIISIPNKQRPFVTTFATDDYRAAYTENFFCDSFQTLTKLLKRTTFNAKTNQTKLYRKFMTHYTKANNKEDLEIIIPI
jgi:hypothetical protein